jgi:hypothetical protein
MSDEIKAGGYSPTELPRERALAEPPSQAYIDLSSNRPKNETTREEARAELREKFEFNLPEAVERRWDLPSIMLPRADDEYVRLFVEARELYTMGYFYSCVAMCGIAGERLIKDTVRDSIFVSVGGVTKRPSEEAFIQLERIDVSALVRFLNASALLADKPRKAAEELITLRNRYAHARGSDYRDDALKAISHLHILIEGTVSVLKDYEMVDGKLMRRTDQAST